MKRIGNFLFHWRNVLFPAGYLLLFITGSDRLLTSDYFWPTVVGLGVAVAGQMLRFVTIGLDYIVRGGKDRQVYAEHLVTTGLFAHCRNPLYVGNYLILVGVGIVSCSPWFLFIALPLFTFAYLAITHAEEAYLHNKFGEAFDAYCSRVPRYGFHFAGLGETLHNAHFNWRRVILKEYGTTFIWMAAFLLAVLQNHIWSASEGVTMPQFDPNYLWYALAVVSVGYLVARYLKKSGRLKE
jgi:protein-S-isoprenylcysteine O-methyltransferase Ste14